MRARLATVGMTLFVVVALGFEASAISAAGQENSNQTANSNRRRPARRKAGNANSAPAAGGEMQANTNTGTPRRPRAKKRSANANSAPAASGEMQANANTGAPRRARTKRAAASSKGIPSGAANCLNALAKLAEADPLVSYEGRPSAIVNDGLLWNDPKSKCAVSDEAQRQKIQKLATAWQTKDAATVRSTLQELGATAGAAGEPAAAKPKKRRPHRTSGNSNSGAAAAPADTSGGQMAGNSNAAKKGKARPKKSKAAGNSNSSGQ